MTEKKKKSGARDLKVRVKKARTVSSKRWLERQLNDPYVARARREGFRSRAAFKLSEIDDKARVLKKGARVVDLGAAPGGWSQVAAKRVGAPGEGKVVAIDLLAMEPVAGVDFMQLDFLDHDAPDKLKALLGGPADVVLSDMAANATGHRKTDHLKIVALVELAADFAREVLAPGGAFLAKVLQGGTEAALLAGLKRDFQTVKHIKPPASRADSSSSICWRRGFAPTISVRTTEAKHSPFIPAKAESVLKLDKRKELGPRFRGDERIGNSSSMDRIYGTRRRRCRGGAAPRSLAACGAPRRRRRGNSACGDGGPSSGEPARRRGIAAPARPAPGDSAPAPCAGRGAGHGPARRADYTFDSCGVTPAARAVRASALRAPCAAVAWSASPARAAVASLAGV